jgi:hypothetical protein
MASALYCSVHAGFLSPQSKQIFFVMVAQQNHQCAHSFFFAMVAPF